MTEILLGSAAFTGIVLFLAAVVMVAKTALLPSRDVSITISGAETLHAKTGQSLMTVMTDSGIDLPGTCGGAGTCGLCRVTIRSGAGESGSTEQARLTRGELAAGMRLACQVVLRDDVAVELPPSLLKAARCTSRVRTNRTVAPLIKELVLELPPDSGLAPEPGAFIEVTAPPYRLSFADIDVAPQHITRWAQLGLRDLSAISKTPVTRAYSIANRPTDSGSIVLNIRLALPPPDSDAPPGIVSSYLFGLSPGDNVTIRGSFGNFRAQSTEREMVIIGGGVGMAPLRAIIWDQLKNIGSHRTISYWYGARSRIDLFYDDEFDELARRHDNFRWTVALSEPHPEDDWHGPRGFIHDVVYDLYLSTHAAPEECEYYLCGPPLMIRAVRSMLEALDIDPESIFFDDFGG